MNNRRYLGMSFTWGRCGSPFLNFFRKNWRLIATVLIPVIYIVVVTRFGFASCTVKAINKWGGLGLQVLGVAVLFNEIDAIMTRVFNAIKDSLICWRAQPTVSGTSDLILPPLTCTGSGSQVPTTTEERVAQLEHELKALELRFGGTLSEFKAEFNKETDALHMRIQDAETNSFRIEADIKQMTRDGVAVGRFGAVLALYGTILGALA